MAAVFIWRGGQKTKRTKQVEERLRLVLAMDQDDNSDASPNEGHLNGEEKVDGAGATTPTAADGHPT